MNHSETELLLKADNEVKVRIREANGRGLEFVVFHDSKSCSWSMYCRCPRALRNRTSLYLTTIRNNEGGPRL